jgi:hypothetical protein
MYGAAIALTPDDAHFLFGKLDGSVAKYAVDGLTENSLGPFAGKYGGPLSVADISFSADSKTAYLVGAEGELHTVDVQTMMASAQPLGFRPFPAHREQRVRMTFAAIRGLHVRSGTHIDKGLRGGK